jgi:ADP-ribosyl-[dinitrogen reductase] hydrolase
MSLKSCMLGLHVGDSLGASLEFCPPSSEWNSHTEILGGGKHRWPVGSPTDDTEMAILVLESLIQHNSFNIYDLSGRFMEWLALGPSDIGRTTFLAINNLMNGVSPFRSGLTGPHDQGNGSLMRCAPLAYFNVQEHSIFKQAAITHNHPLCKIADYILIQAIRDAEKGLSKTEIYQNAIHNSQENPILFDHISKIQDLTWKELPTSGFVVHTLGAAFWGLLKSNTFEEALISIVNRGDDADSAGAVCGALCDSFYGETAIPGKWLQKIQLRSKIERILI